MSQKIDIANAELETMLHGSLIEGIQVFRRTTGFDLKSSKDIVEAFRSKAKDWREFFNPKHKCEHCGGTGFSH